jgi:uncharacterized protein YfaS (alpha-2-macroglobulin family)
MAMAVALIVGFGGGVLTATLAHWGGGGVTPGSRHEARTDQADWPFFGRPRAAGAPRPGESRPEGFAVWKTRQDTSGSQPQACVRFTRPLDPSRSYSDFVLLSPEGTHAPAVSARGDELCLAGVGLSGRKVTLLQGLPDKAGETLAKGVDVAFDDQDAPPYVGFAGEGVILPREESDGAAIETVNVTRLAVEVWRVPDRNLVRRSISAPSPTGEGEYPDDYGEDSPDEEGRIVWKGFVRVAGAPAGGKAVTVFPLGAVLKSMSPGGYVIKARDASAGRDPGARGGGEPEPAQARRWIIFTDMAMTAYKGSKSLDVVLRSLQTARTLPGAAVSLLARDGETLASTRTDAQGRASFAAALLAGEGASAARMVMAYGQRGDLAVLDLARSPVDLSKQGTGGREGAPDLTDGRTADQDVDAFVYSDRGIYRPGERIHLAALVRDREARAVVDRKGYILVKRPSGVEFHRWVFDRSGGGAVLADVDLPATAPRGKWTAELHIEGLDRPAGALTLSVEDFAPQRLAVSLAAHPELPLAGAEVRPVDVTARFLYGAVGSGLRTQAEERLRFDPQPFPRFADYRFGDASAPFEEKYVDLGAGVTDAEGRTRLAVSGLAAGASADPLVAQLTAAVFEPGGRPVREGATLKVRPRPLYLGVRVDEPAVAGDHAAPVGLDVVALDGAGRRIAAAGVSWRLVSEAWTFDWFQQNGRWQWRRTSRDIVIAQGALDIGADEPARLNRRLGWGDYRLELAGTQGARTVRKFSVGWGAPTQDAEAPDLVRLGAGARAHRQGDEIAVTIKAQYGGEAQVAVATDRIIDFRTLSLPKGEGVVRLKSSAAWGGGAYVLVSVVQPRNPATTPVPRRAVGLIYVPLDPGNRRLKVDVGTPARIDSRAPVLAPIRVEGLGPGERAYVTVAAVDEGILALTKFDSPDPARWYFGKRALSLDYRDDYGRLLNANMGAPTNVDFGGDELGGQGLTVTPIKTVALWSGVVKTGPGGKVLVRLPPSDFNGQLRVMAVAWTAKAVGSASTALTVRQPVVVDLDLPRFLAPGDRPIATLELQDVDGAPGDYLARGLASQGLAMPLAQTFRLAQGQRIAQGVAFAAPAITGVGQVGVKVSGPGFAVEKDYPIETRLGWGPVTRVTTALQRPGESFTPSPALLAGLAAGEVEMSVSYSPIQGFDPTALVVALNDYPFGCTEQLVSTAYAQLYAAQAGADPRARRRLADAVGKLIDRQSLDGAFGLWRVGDGEADPWIGAYATEFLLAAQAQGAPMPAEAVDHALAAMRQISRPEGFAAVGYRLRYAPTWGESADASKAATIRMRSRASAYALLVLAEAGRGDLPRLRWWRDNQMASEHSPVAMAQIGAGLALMGDRARAHAALMQAVRALGWKDPDDWYQSPLRDLAAVIALAYQAGEPDIARSLQGRLAGAVRDPDALNTQEEAFLLQAGRAMLRASGPVRVEAQGASALAAGPGAPRWAVGRLADARFLNRGAGPIWRSVTVRGTPLQAPEASSHGLVLTKSVLTLSGAPADLAAMRQGARVVVRLSGRSDQGRTLPLVIDDALPAGWEIETVLGPDDAQPATRTDHAGPFAFLGVLNRASAQESRDDRYVAALSLPGHQGFVVAYVARAVTRGAFFLPGAQAVDMYHPAVAARTASGRLVVQAPD